MVGVDGSSPFAPTKIGREIKHLAETLGAFFLAVPKKYQKPTPRFTAFIVGGASSRQGVHFEIRCSCFRRQCSGVSPLREVGLLRFASNC